MADPIDRLVDDIVQRVQKRMQPPAPAPAPAAAPAASGAPAGSVPAGADLARMIDHTLLKAEVTKDELKKLCQEAMEHRFKTVCVNSANIAYCASLLRGSSVVPIAVVGFPLGAMSIAAKAFETREAIAAGAAEIDMVINLGALKDHDYVTVIEDIQAVVKAAAPKPVKVILETGLLSDEEKVIACALAKAGRAAFVKTSTGFSKGAGATAPDIALMRRVVGKDMGVKASGGVRTREDALAMIAAGANRIGASSSVAIVTGKAGDKQGY